MRSANLFIGALQMYNFFFKWTNFFLGVSFFFLKCLYIYVQTEKNFFYFFLLFFWWFIKLFYICTIQ